MAEFEVANQIGTSQEQIIPDFTRELGSNTSESDSIYLTSSLGGSEDVQITGQAPESPGEASEGPFSFDPTESNERPGVGYIPVFDAPNTLRDNRIGNDDEMQPTTRREGYCDLLMSSRRTHRGERDFAGLETERPRGDFGALDPLIGGEEQRDTGIIGAFDPIIDEQAIEESMESTIKWLIT